MQLAEWGAAESEQTEPNHIYWRGNSIMIKFIDVDTIKWQSQEELMAQRPDRAIHYSCHTPLVTSGQNGSIKAIQGSLHLSSNITV